MAAHLVEVSNLCKCFSGHTDMNTKDTDRFKGSLVGAVVGDCLGAPFEFSTKAFPISELKVGVEGFESKHGSARYTDDTAMTRSVATSLIENRGFNAQDMAKRFAEEYYSDRNRCYGANVPYVFRDLYAKKYGDDVFRSAKQQFGGSGSYGNGGAMRIAPVALFGAFNLDKLTEKGNPFSRTILYAISLGGDTDTIASMAGATAGAYYGIESIPKVWQEKCEGVKDAKKQAEQLYELASTV